MTYPPSQNLYGSSIGNAPQRPYVISTIDPTSHDVNYPLLQLWYNKTTQVVWTLLSFSSSAGIVSATWEPSTGVQAIDSIAVQATTAPGVTPVVPTAAGLVTLNGATVAAQTIPVQSRSIAANTAQIEVQRASTSASTNATQQGLASFDSASFAVDANGWVQLAGGGLAIDSLIPNSGTSPVVPTGTGQVTMQGSGSITTVGGANSITPQLTGLTNHSVLVGAGTDTITKLTVGSTGELLVGATGADPAFGTSANGNFTFTSSTAGSTRSLTVTNTDNTNASSHALSQITTGGASGGDPFQTFTVSGAQSWSQGVDNSSSDSYVLSASTALGTTNVITATTGGILSFPLQLAFVAVLGTTDSNVTGNGATYSFGAGNALTITNQQGSSMATNGVFTVPATGAGWYSIAYSLQVTGITAAMLTGVSYVSNAFNGNFYFFDYQNPFAVVNATGNQSVTFSGGGVVQLPAGSTLQVTLIISGGVGDTADVMGGMRTSLDYSWFSGCKIA